mgnify:FL=1
MHFGMQPNPALSAGMRLTTWDWEKLTADKLRPYCREKDGRFFCVYPVRGQKVQLGEYTSLQACNAAWDAEKERRRKAAEAKPRKPAEKGYSVRENALGTTYQAGINYKSKHHHLGTFNHKELARARHIEAVDKVNEGKFEEWFKRLKK